MRDEAAPVSAFGGLELGWARKAKMGEMQSFLIRISCQIEAGPKELRADMGSPPRWARNDHFDKGIVHFLVYETRRLRFRDLEAWSMVGPGKPKRVKCNFF